MELARVHTITQVHTIWIDLVYSYFVGLWSQSAIVKLTVKG